MQFTITFLLSSIFSLILTSSFSWAFVSNIDSSVDGIDIPNTHTVDANDEAMILRGNAPRNKADVKQLVEFGVEKVLIFKNQVRSEVDKEIAWLDDLGIGEQNRIHIPFKWKDFTSFQDACQQTVDALRIIKDANENNETIFFHCTVGEDRTGMLAGLWRMYDQSWSTDRAFQEEMCQRGYADGSSRKGKKIIHDVLHAELTPIFAKMSQILKHEGDLNSVDCTTDPESYLDGQKIKEISSWRCQGPIEVLSTDFLFTGQWLHIFNEKEDEYEDTGSYDLIELNIERDQSCTAFHKTIEVSEGFDQIMGEGKLQCKIKEGKISLRDTHTGKTFLRMSGKMSYEGTELVITNYNNSANVPEWKRTTKYNFFRSH